MNFEKEREWNNNLFYSFIIMCHYILLFIAVCFTNDKFMFGLSLFGLIMVVAWFITSLVMVFKIEHDNTYCMNASIKGRDITEDAFKNLDDVEEEIKMNFSIPDLVCHIYDERDKIFIDIIKKDIEGNPEYYKGIDLVTISREDLRDLLIKGREYNKLQNDLKFSNENFDMLMKRYENLKDDLQNEASNAEFYKSERDNLERTLEELREACDRFLYTANNWIHMFNVYNPSDKLKYSKLKEYIEEFEDEINGEGN